MTAINNLDDLIYNLIIKIQNTQTTGIMIFISFLASAITLILLSIVFGILLKNKKYAKNY